MSPATTAPRAAPFDSALGIVVALAMTALGLFNLKVLNDGDTYTHLVAGQWMLAHGQVPHTDPFSYTFPGAPWHAHEWFAELLSALAYRADGWGGVLALHALAMGAGALILANYLRRWLSGPGLLLALILALACTTASYLARPHLLALPLMIAWVAALLTAREAGRAPHPATALIMLIWANLHGGFAFGLAILAALGLEAVVEAKAEARRPAIRGWGLAGLLAVAAAACNPEGISGLLFPFQLTAMTSLPWIVEWTASDFSKLAPLELSLIAVIYFGFSRGVRVPTMRLLLFLGMLHMALAHRRHALIAGPLGAMLLAEPFARTMGEVGPKQPTRAPLWGLAATGLAIAALLAVRVASPIGRVDNPSTPWRALDHVPADLRAQPVLNDYGFGGYLTWRGVRPFIDGRADLFGDAFLKKYMAINNGEPQAVESTLAQYKVAWTIFPAGAAANAVMDREPGWRRLYADDVAVVYARASSPPSQPPPG
jgi:hypothetical protein